MRIHWLMALPDLQEEMGQGATLAHADTMASFLLKNQMAGRTTEEIHPSWWSRLVESMVRP